VAFGAGLGLGKMNGVRVGNGVVVGERVEVGAKVGPTPASGVQVGGRLADVGVDEGTKTTGAGVAGLKGLIAALGLLNIVAIVARIRIIPKNKIKERISQIESFMSSLCWFRLILHYIGYFRRVVFFLLPEKVN